MIKKMLAGPVVAGVVLLGTAGMADAQEIQTTPVDDAIDEADDAIDDATDGNGDDDDSSKVGLLGLLGLAGLAGLAGLRRREPVVRYDDRTIPPR